MTFSTRTTMFAAAALAPFLATTAAVAQAEPERTAYFSGTLSPLNVVGAVAMAGHVPTAVSFVGAVVCVVLYHAYRRVVLGDADQFATPERVSEQQVRALELGIHPGTRADEEQGRWGQARTRRCRRPGGAARAQHRLDLVGGVRQGEEVALADAAAGLGEELALRRRLDALRDHLEVQPARQRIDGLAAARATLDALAGGADHDQRRDSAVRRRRRQAHRHRRRGLSRRRDLCAPRRAAAVSRPMIADLQTLVVAELEALEDLRLQSSALRSTRST